MEALVEHFREFKAYKGTEQFGTLIQRLFFSSHGEFFAMTYREKERIDDLIHPANVHNVQIKLDKWIAVQHKAQ